MTSGRIPDSTSPDPGQHEQERDTPGASSNIAFGVSLLSAQGLGALCGWAAGGGRPVLAVVGLVAALGVTALVVAGRLVEQGVISKSPTGLH